MDYRSVRLPCEKLQYEVRRTDQYQLLIAHCDLGSLKDCGEWMLPTRIPTEPRMSRRRVDVGLRLHQKAKRTNTPPAQWRMFRGTDQYRTRGVDSIERSPCHQSASRRDRSLLSTPSPFCLRNCGKPRAVTSADRLVCSIACVGQATDEWTQVPLPSVRPPHRHCLWFCSELMFLDGASRAPLHAAIIND